MRRNGLKKKLVALCAFFALLLNYPLLGIYQQGGSVWGVPRFYFSVFVVWLIMILLIMILVEQRQERS